MEIESLPSCYRLQSDDVEESTTAKPQVEMAPIEAAVEESQLEDRVIVAAQPNLSASLIEGLTVLLHRSLAISMDSQRAWNVLTHGDLHFLVQHFHWHQHQHGPQVIQGFIVIWTNFLITIVLHSGHVYINSKEWRYCIFKHHYC